MKVTVTLYFVKLDLKKITATELYNKLLKRIDNKKLFFF